MRTRRRGLVSTSKFASSTASSMPPASSNFNSSTETTMHPSSMVHVDCTSLRPSQCTQRLQSSRRQMLTKTTKLGSNIPSVSHSPGSQFKAFWLIPILMLVLSYCQPACAQSPFGPFESRGRFQNYANGKTVRDVLLSVVKNISEDTLPGTLLLNFRAEDRNNPTYNFS